MQTVYEADGTPVTLNPIDARERIAVGLAFERPPGTPALAKEVLHRVPAPVVVKPVEVEPIAVEKHAKHKAK